MRASGETIPSWSHSAFAPTAAASRATPAQIAAKLPTDYYSGDQSTYVQDWAQSKSFYSTTGIMPKDGPKTQYKVLATFQPDLPGKHINLAKTYTNEFVLKALKTKAPAAK